MKRKNKQTSKSKVVFRNEGKSKNEQINKQINKQVNESQNMKELYTEDI